MIDTFIGALGIVLLVLFLGFLAIKIASVPLTLIIIAVLTMAIVDLVQTLRQGGNGGT